MHGKGNVRQKTISKLLTFKDAVPAFIFPPPLCCGVPAIAFAAFVDGGAEDAVETVGSVVVELTV